MLRIVTTIAAALSVASSVPAQLAPAGGGCLQFVPDPERLRLVQAVQLPADRSKALLVDVRNSGADNLGDFLSKGGSLVVVDGAEQSVGVINRDTLAPAAINSVADVVKVSHDSVTELKAGAVIAGTANGAAQIDTGQQFNIRNLLPPLKVDVESLRLKHGNPNGMEIGGFDGVPAPTVVIGPADGTPAPTPIALPTNTAATLAQARALNSTVAIYFRDNETQAILACNGFQIAPGLVLTNLHCALPRHSGHVVHFGELHLQPDSLLPGTPVTGSVRCPATVVSPAPASNGRLDFALLKINGAVPPPYADAIASLDDGSDLTPQVTAPPIDIPVTQIQYWLTNAATSQSRQYQKYLMKPPTCAIVSDTSSLNVARSYFCNSNGIKLTDPIDPAGIGHVCDSEQGSSGSPLFDQQLAHVVALHRGGGELIEARNCAIPAPVIYSQLRAWGYLAG